jgi:hypothetical protein
VLLQGEDLLFELVQALEVVGGEQLALDDGEADRDWLSQDACTGRWTICAFG